MPIALAFNPSALPRTMTRQEWREADRWRRKVQEVLRRRLRERLERGMEDLLQPLQPPFLPEGR